MSKLIFAAFLACAAILYSPKGMAQKKEKKRPDVIVEYEKYQSFDFGSLQIEGKILAPGDLTINNEGNRNTDYPLFNRKHYRNKIIKDIHSIR